MSLLHPGDTFPQLTLNIPGGQAVQVPGSLGFVLDRRGKVIVSVYSSGAIGRLVPEDVLGLVRYLREHAAASA